MKLQLCWLLTFGSVVGMSPPAAGAPKISLLHPNGATPGGTADISIRGDDLKQGSRFVCPAVDIDVANVEGSRDRFQVRIPDGTSPGIYPAWIISSVGVSNALPFVIDPLPQVTIDGHDSARRQVPTPAVVAGVLRRNAIHELVFEGRKGQRLGIDVWADRIGSTLDPRIVLLEPSGRVLEEVDDVTGLGCDCRMAVTLPAAGEYTLQIHDSTYSQEDPQPYRVRIGAGFPHIVFPLGGKTGTTTKFHLEGGTLSQAASVSLKVVPTAFEGLSWTAGPECLFTIAPGLLPEVSGGAEGIEPPVVINSRLENEPVARHIVKAKPGTKLHCKLEAASLGSPLDAVLTARTQQGKQIAQEDDRFLTAFTDSQKTNIGYSIVDPLLTATVPDDGTLVLEVADRLERSGGEYVYRMSILNSASAFRLTADRSVWTVAEGKTTQVELQVDRAGFDGPIRIAVEGLPPEWSAPAVELAAKETKATINITAPAESQISVARFRVTGMAVDTENASPQIAVHELIFGMERFKNRQRLPKSLYLTEFLLVVQEESP